jgi:hypothetical protein
MSTAIARRLDRVESERLTAAISHFGQHCHQVFSAPDPAADATDAADPTAGETPFVLALWPVIDLATTIPADQGAIRAALRTVAPFVGLAATASPLAILVALEDVLAQPRAAVWG